MIKLYEINTAYQGHRKESLCGFCARSIESSINSNAEYLHFPYMFKVVGESGEACKYAHEHKLFGIVN